MFGYVRIAKGELRVWEYETYKTVYCSLCRRLGKTYGVFARLTLSYDFTFLAVLALSLKDGCLEFEKKRCAFNPLKKCQYCKRGDEELELASAAATVMVYYKLLDNIEDSKGIKKIGYKMLLPFFKSKNKKAAKLYPEIESVVENYIAAQVSLEKENCRDLDRLSEPTSSALGKIFEMCSDEDEQKRVLYQLGYCIGKWIYLVDLADDIERDIAGGLFNPLKADIPENTAPIQYAKDRLEPLLNSCICNAQLSFELLDIKKYKGIIENILYLGLSSVQNKVFEKESKNERPL